MIDRIKEKALNEDVPIIKDDGLVFLLHLIEERQCRNILELGTAVGYSSINMAMMSKDILIDTLEKSEEMYTPALANIKAEGLEDQIKVHFTAIEDFVTDRKYDLIFVDAAKAQYMRYTEQFIDNLSENGIFVYDNMIFHGMVYDVEGIKNRNTRSLVRKLIKFLELMRNDERFDIMFYEDVGDGLLVASRRKR